jgi:hypothetical protein
VYILLHYFFTMIKIKLLTLLLFTSVILHAQHLKLSVTQGIGFDSQAKYDSLFFADKCNATQFRVGYHYGKLGIICNNTIIRQRATPLNSIDERVPVILGQTNRTISDVQSINTTLGLELCVPLAKRRMQLNLYAAYGISISSSDTAGLFDVQVPLYTHKVNRKTTGCWQAGFSVNYKFNRHFAMKWQNELDHYKLPFNGLDLRRSPSLYTGSQVKNILISSVGVQYTF